MNPELIRMGRRVETQIRNAELIVWNDQKEIHREQEEIQVHLVAIPLSPNTIHILS